jgi:uncharacterized protein YjbJ (UPF0337 family)
MTNANTPKSDSNDSMADKAKATADKAADAMKSQAEGVADRVTAEAGQYADRAKSLAADEVKNVSSALRNAADEMRGGSAQERTFGQIADTLADVAESIRGKDLGEMVNSVTLFAKRNPVAFIGGAALLGFAATRFGKASGDGHSDYSARSSSRTSGSHASGRQEMRSGSSSYGSHQGSPATGTSQTATTPSDSAGGTK